MYMFLYIDRKTVFISLPITCIHMLHLEFQTGEDARPTRALLVCGVGVSPTQFINARSVYIDVIYATLFPAFS
jgi:hypothetical protein